VPLPNHLHVEWTLKALDAGKHVLTEKPIALSASEIDDLIKARDASGCLAAEAYMIAHHPQWARVRELIKGGRIGKLMRVDAAPPTSAIALRQAAVAFAISVFTRWVACGL